MKRFLKSSLSLLLAITIIFSSAYVGLSEFDFDGLFAVDAKAAAEDDFGFIYSSVGNSYFATYKGSNKITELIIPGTYNGLLVTNFMFSNFLRAYNNLASVVMSNGITSIGVWTFIKCPNLTSITIPESVTNIASGAFSNCSKLVIYGVPGSYAESFAKSEGIPFKNATKYGQLFYKKEISPDTYAINVKALNKSKNEVPAVGADVTVYCGTDVVMTKKTDSLGYVAFTKNELINNGVREDDFLGCTVSAHLQVGSDFELCSENINNNGVWQGQRLLSCTELVVDEPRWKPSLKVLINKSDVLSCKEILKDYSNKFAQSTNGHVLIDDFDLVIVPDIYSSLKKDELEYVIKDKDIDICMVENSSTGADGSVGWYNVDRGNLDNIVGGYKLGGRIWCPVNRSYCAETLCHESGHYLFGFLDEYASAIGFYGSSNNLWEGGNIYSYDYTGAFLGGPDGKISSKEKNAAYWTKNYKGTSTVGKINRPSDEPINFGLMEHQYANSEAIEMSSSSTYVGVVSKITDYNNLTTEQIKPYTQQYFYSNASCEEKMAHELNRIADDNGYSTNYAYATRMQRADYWYAGGDAVTFTESYMIASGELLLSGSATLQFSSGTEIQEVVSNVEFNYEGSKLNITSQSPMDVSITDFEDTVVFSAILSEDNNYTVGFETTVGSSYYINATQIIAGETVATKYFLETISVDSNFNFNNESPTVSLYSENETQAVILHNGDTVTNGDYSSVIGEYNIISNNVSETSGDLQISLSYDLDIDYSSLTWFYMADSDWVALETIHSTDDHCTPNFSCDYAGNGKYCLMAKSAGTKTLSTPTNITVTTEGQTADGEVLVQFNDDNSDILNYNIYYSTEPITAENYESAERVVVSAGSNQAYITVDDVGTKYYFAVQAVGTSGVKSDISENVSFISSYIDSDNDGIPDYWLNIYYQLKDVEDVANADSDEDGLTNLVEYQNGTNPLSPDTDGDNVYDAVELENNLNPLEPMTDGVIDDYIVVYNNPDLSVINTSFDDNYIYFDVINDTDGKAMRTIVEVFCGEERIASWTANINSYSSESFSVERSLISDFDDLKIKIDDNQITRDIDYSNNVYEYIPATNINVQDITFVKGINKHILPITSVPVSSTDMYKLTILEGNADIILDEKRGALFANGIGKANIKVETLSGLSDICTITVVPFKDCEYTEFDCELINSNSEVTITGYIGNDTDIVIPDYISGYPVTQLSANCIPLGVTNVTVPATVTNIDSQAFNCESLESITIDANNKTYSSVDGVLYNPEKTTILRVPVAYPKTIFSIPDNVTIIGEKAFENCKNLTNIEFCEGLENVEENAFAGCTSLEYAIFSQTEIKDISTYFSFGEATLNTTSALFVGTGDVVTVNDSDYTIEFECVIRSDVNSDGVCDALDAAQVALVLNGQKSIDGAYKMAADSNSDDIVDIDDYQAIVNKVVA